MGEMRMISLHYGDRPPAERARMRREAIKACLPFIGPNGMMRVGYEASMVTGGGIVFSPRDAQGDFLVIECDTIEDAMSIAAEANGTTEQEVRERMRMEMEYLNNLRRGHRPQSDAARTTKKHPSGRPAK